MKPITQFLAPTMVLAQTNIDTDQIIPARFLTTTERAGLGRFAFYDWRYRADGSDNPDSAWHQQDIANAEILVAGRNFGCGSSREHAPWALLDLGFRAVISSEIADIFRSNALKNGLLPIVLDADIVNELIHQPGITLSIDLAERCVIHPDGRRFVFAIDAFSQTCLLQGVDQLGYLLRSLPEIDAFEDNRAQAMLGVA